MQTRASWLRRYRASSVLCSLPEDDSFSGVMKSTCRVISRQVDQQEEWGCLPALRFMIGMPQTDQLASLAGGLPSPTPHDSHLAAAA